MSIPTSNLYNFIHQVTEKKYWIKYFYPWGSKSLSDVKDRLHSNSKEDYNKIVEDYQNNIFIKDIWPNLSPDNINFLNFQPVLFCYDQEPLYWELYKDELIPEELISRWHIDSIQGYQNSNLRYTQPESFIHHWILLHSELNSQQVEYYEQTDNFACAYWWSHALISRDWYRFAEYDKDLSYKKYEKIFLIYSRDASGSRSYRKTFIEKVKQNCYNYQLGSFDNTEVNSDSSAVYSAEDISKTAISVVCETVFDQRIHLTEKTCRALACGHPFILLAGPESLKYLRSYGFKTFSPFIDETYDTIQDSQERLNAVIKEMQRIEACTNQSEIIDQCREIAKYNQKLFFSKEFFNKVVNELVNNVKTASQKSVQKISWKRMWNIYKQLPRTERFITQRPFMLTLIRHLKKGGTLENYVPPDLD